MASLRARMIWTAALAAVPLAATAAPEAPEAGTQVETLIVTAQKRAENVQDVPISMEVVGGRAIEELGVRRFEDLAKYVPNLTVQPTPGANQIYIRGIGSGAQNFAFEQDVSLYIDGVYAGRNRQFMAPFFDIDRVEVLRGPQGALLGKNTAAGAISIISAQPTMTFRAGADIGTLFDRGGINASAFISGPLSDTLSGRLAAKVVRQDGYVHNRFTGQDVPREEDALIRGILRFAPSESLDVSAKVEYTDYTVKGTQAISIFPGSKDFQHAEKNAAPPFGVPESDNTKTWNLLLTANYQLGDLTLTSLTGYSTYDATKYTAAGSDVPELWLSTQLEDFDQTSQEFRLTSPTGGRFEYIVGAYADENTFSTQFDTNYAIVVTGHTNQLFDQKTRSWSVFGQGVFNLSDQLRFLGSLRYSHERKRATYDQILISGIPLNAPRSLAGSRTESNVDPSLTAQFRPTADVMLYATYAQGSKAGGFVSNSGTVTQATFEFSGERSTNYEVGLKSTFLEGAALFNLTVFRTKFDDLQVSNFIPVTGLVIGNAGSAITKGAEATAALKPLPGLELSTSLAYLDAKYKDFPGGPCIFPNVPCNQATNNIGGTTIPNTSKWSGNVRGEYTWRLPNDLKVTGTVVTTFRSSYYVEANLNPTSRQAPYGKLDARLELSGPGDRWAVAVFGRNLTDEHTFNFSYFWPFAAAPSSPHQLKYLEETRTVGVSGQVRF